MQTPIVRNVAAAVFAICLIAGSASAQGKGHDKDKGDDKNHGDDKHEAEKDQHLGNNDQHHDLGRPVLVTTNNGVYRKVPPGLAKKGGLPPGQAKKYYHPAEGIPVMRQVFLRHGYTVVRTQPYGTSQYVYYRQANGPIQRAVIVPGTSQLGFQNVPQTLVQEILSRLY
jgi:hypothetical protein